MEAPRFGVAGRRRAPERGAKAAGSLDQRQTQTRGMENLAGSRSPLRADRTSAACSGWTRCAGATLAQLAEAAACSWPEAPDHRAPAIAWTGSCCIPVAGTAGPSWRVMLATVPADLCRSVCDSGGLSAGLRLDPSSRPLSGPGAVACRDFVVAFLAEGLCLG